MAVPIFTITLNIISNHLSIVLWKHYKVFYTVCHLLSYIAILMNQNKDEC